MNIAPVTSARDTSKLRKLHETIETHHRGLQALEVDPNIYEVIEVPAVIELAESMRLTITRGKTTNKWKMDDLLNQLLKEVELREEYSHPPEKSKHGESDGGPKGRSHGPNTSST